MPIGTADELFLDELRDIYSAEKQAVRIYPRLTKAVASSELEEALRTHLEETKGHIDRLDRVFEILEKRSSGKTCEGMKGVLEESAEALEEIEEEGPLRDVTSSPRHSEPSTTRLPRTARLFRWHKPWARTRSPSCCQKPWKRRSRLIKSSPRSQRP